MTAPNPYTFTLESRRIALFETLVTVAHLKNSERLIADLEAAIRTRMAESDSLHRSNHGGWHSDLGMTHWGGSAAVHLTQAAVRIVHQLCSFTGGERDDFDWTVNMWANVSSAGALNFPHVHPGNVWAAVFYIDMGDEADGTDVGGELYFEDPRYPASVMNSASIRLIGANGKPQLPSIKLKVQRGDFVFFPAWLRHGVSEYRGSSERISIALNLNARQKLPSAAPSRG